MFSKYCIRSDTDLLVRLCWKVTKTGHGYKLLLEIWALYHHWNCHVFVKCWNPGVPDFS